MIMKRRIHGHVIAEISTQADFARNAGNPDVVYDAECNMFFKWTQKITHIGRERQRAVRYNISNRRGCAVYAPIASTSLEMMQNGRSSPCRVGEQINFLHGQNVRQIAGNKQGGIAYERKKETAQAVELAAVLYYGAGDAP